MKPTALTVYLPAEERRYLRRVALDLTVSASQLARLGALLVAGQAETLLRQGWRPERVVESLRRQAESSPVPNESRDQWGGCLVIGTRRLKRHSAARPPFVAHARFEQDFRLVWGRPAACYCCGRPVRAGQFVAFLRPMQPETLHHVPCKRKRDAEEGDAR